jgi:hypothetical protein
VDLEILSRELMMAGVDFAAGLTSSEIERAERSYGFQFPPDLKAFISYALPIGKRWPDWRDTDNEYIRDMLAWPCDGICFDVEHNVFWWSEWGEKPASLEAAFSLAKEFVERAPKLIPVHGHRYLPEKPNAAGNPVLSVYQTDIVYYGNDLEDYFSSEFHLERSRTNEEPARIEFWSDVIDWANGDPAKD